VKRPPLRLLESCLYCSLKLVNQKGFGALVRFVLPLLVAAPYTPRSYIGTAPILVFVGRKSHFRGHSRLRTEQHTHRQFAGAGQDGLVRRGFAIACVHTIDDWVGIGVSSIGVLDTHPARQVNHTTLYCSAQSRAAAATYKFAPPNLATPSVV
jgi:hypothetical protein